MSSSFRDFHVEKNKKYKEIHLHNKFTEFSYEPSSSLNVYMLEGTVVKQ